MARKARVSKAAFSRVGKVRSMHSLARGRNLKSRRGSIPLPRTQVFRAELTKRGGR